MKEPKKTAVKSREEFYNAIDSQQLTLSKTLKAMRKLIAKTQKEFAELTGVGLPVIRAIEQECCNPTLETLEKIGRPFGLTVAFKRKKPRDSEPSIDLCDECEPEDRSPGMIDWGASDLGGEVNKIKSSGRCTYCNTIHVNCLSCSENTALPEHTYDKWVPCMGGCGTKFMIKEQHTGKGMYDYFLRVK